MKQHVSKMYQFTYLELRTVSSRGVGGGGGLFTLFVSFCPQIVDCNVSATSVR